MLGDLGLYIFKKYGLKLSEEEIKEVLEWFEKNKYILTDEDTTEEKLTKYLYERFEGRPLILCEEDHSNMNYLLALLKDASKSNK